MIYSRTQSLALAPKGSAPSKPTASRSPTPLPALGAAASAPGWQQWRGLQTAPLRPRTGPGPPLFQHLAEVHQLLPEV